jgi:drug/metabolite transporter superfamily protein YnfA
MATVLEPSLIRGPEPEGSDRSFGFVFAVVFVIIGCWPLLYLEQPRWWALIIALAFAIVAFIRPGILRPFNRAWLAFGRLLHRIMSPLILGTVFFLCVTPIAYIMRLLGKDVLSLSRRSDLASYWLPRPPSPPAGETMKRQF